MSDDLIGLMDKCPGTVEDEESSLSLSKCQRLYSPDREILLTDFSRRGCLYKIESTKSEPPTL